jgi:hypothetical protein
MAEFDLGPNGGLVYCIEYLERNIDWLFEKLDKLKGWNPTSSLEKYLLFDLPGQVELFTNHDSLKNIIQKLEKRGFRLCVVNLNDSHYCVDPSKYMSMLMVSLKTMLQLGCPQVNVLSKIDLIESYGTLDFNLDFYTQVQDLTYLLDRLESDIFTVKYKGLSKAICDLVQEFGLVSFTTLCIEDKLSVYQLLQACDTSIGYVDNGLNRDNSSLLQSATNWDAWDRLNTDIAERYLIEQGAIHIKER